MNAPLAFVWLNGALHPLQNFAGRARERFREGDTYALVEYENNQRSGASHRQYFAAIREAWQTLPDERLEDFPTPEHLRKKALIRAGYRDERSIVCSSKAEAQRIRAFIRPVDDFAIVTVRDSIVTVFTAKSQSIKAMGRKEFQESKDAVFRQIDDLLGVDRGTVGERAKAA